MYRVQVKIITESKGAPDTERIDLSTVRVSWDDVFPKGTACEEVLCVHKLFASISTTRWTSWSSPHQIHQIQSNPPGGLPDQVSPP